MSIKQYLVSNEEVVKKYSNIKVGRGGHGVSKDFTGYVTNQRVIFLKKNKMHEITLNALGGMDWERRRKLSILVLVAGILLCFFFILIIPLIIGVILIVLWFVLRHETLVIYGMGKEIVVAAENRAVLDDILTTIRNVQATGGKPLEAPTTEKEPESPEIQITEPPTEKITCSNCGAKNPPHAMFCYKCGATMEEEK